jgi:hypothetical protein
MFGRRPYIGSISSVVATSVNAGSCDFEKIKTWAQELAPEKKVFNCFDFFEVTAARIAREETITGKELIKGLRPIQM